MEGAQNSCNPVFIEVGLRLGIERYYKYFRQFGLLDKTGTDLPGEAGTIMHQKKNMGEVELATVSFGQSFQITPVQLAATVSSLINGGRRVTPHFGVAVLNPDRTEGEKLIFPVKEGIVSEETSKEIREILETVVSQGSGKNAKLKDMPSVGKLPLLRHCQEVQTVIFPLFWDLHLQKIRRYWDCVLFMIRKESIMEGQ